MEVYLRLYVRVCDDDGYVRMCVRVCGWHVCFVTLCGGVSPAALGSEAVASG